MIWDFGMVWEVDIYYCTDGELIQIIYMRSKSEAGTKLDRINRDIGVANKIFMDNAPKQTGYNTEIQRVEILEIMEVQTTDPESPWQNKSESVIKIIRVKSRRR